MSTATMNLAPSNHSFAHTKRRPSAMRLKQHQPIKSHSMKSGLLRILVVDDDKDTADTMGMLVQLWGYDVAKAYNGMAAVEIASTFRPHVLLLDLAMPGMNGCHLATLLRQLPFLQKALMVAITGCTGTEHRSLCEQAGFDYFFLKPVSTNIVERLLFMEQERLTKPPVTLNLSHQMNHNPLQTELRAWISDCVGASYFQSPSVALLNLEE